MEICARDLGHVLRTSLDTRRSVVAKRTNETNGLLNGKRFTKNETNSLLLINHGILLMYNYV